MHPLAPLLTLLTVLLVFGFIGYVVYTIANDIADTTSKKMQKKNVVVTKDGMKVGVRGVREESYVDNTQRYVLPGVLNELRGDNLEFVLGEVWTEDREQEQGPGGF